LLDTFHTFLFNRMNEHSFFVFTQPANFIE
jgi:hypothetical protein